MITRDALISIGHFNKTHGIAGEIAATTLVEPDVLAALRCIVTEIDGIYVPFFIDKQRNKSQSSILLTINGIQSETDAATLVGKDFFAPKTDYDRIAAELADDDDDTLPVDYFIGFTVTDSDNTVGTVTDIDDTTDNVLFLVTRPDGSLTRIPAVDDLIEFIDTDNRILAMNLPEGLLEL